MKLENYVKDVVSKNRLKNQFEIVEKLKELHNVNLVQSNLSKILKRINAVKIFESGESFYIIKDERLMVDEWIAGLIVNIDSNPSSIIIKTHEGTANVISQIIDKKSLDNIIGTISGHDTILVIIKDFSRIKETETLLKKLLKSNPYFA